MSLATSLTIFLSVGLVCGILLGLIGVGMALISVPLLTVFLPRFGIGPDAAPLTALATSMAIVSVGSISSIVSHHRLGNVDWKLVRITVPASLIGVVLGSLAASHLPGEALKWIFCTFLVVIAIKMLLPAKRTVASHAADTGPWLYRAAGGLIGMAGSLVGAGGGIFMVPFLSSRGHRMAKAVATSTTIGLPVSIVGALIYASEPSPVRTGAMLGFVFLPAFFGLSLGSVLAAPLGARVASKVPTHALKTGFAIILIVLAIKTLLG
ncbi:MAG TPA: sulfite exporter TauE/SafE family protein [Pseudolabrys sp.]